MDKNLKIKIGSEITQILDKYDLRVIEALEILGEIQECILTGEEISKTSNLN